MAAVAASAAEPCPPSPLPSQGARSVRSAASEYTDCTPALPMTLAAFDAGLMSQPRGAAFDYFVSSATADAVACVPQYGGSDDDAALMAVALSQHVHPRQSLQSVSPHHSRTDAWHHSRLRVQRKHTRHKEQKPCSRPWASCRVGV